MTERAREPDRVDEIASERIILPAAELPQLLGGLVAAALADAGRAAEVIAHGGAWIDSARATTADQLVPPGAVISIRLPPGGVYPQVMLTAAQIIFEDDDLLAINKPAGTYVDAVPWDTQGNLRQALTSFLRERNGTAPTLHLVHRLDRDTTGVLLFSKNPAVNAPLQRAFINAAVTKHYLALCSGEPADDHFVLDTGHGRSRRGVFRVYEREEVGTTLVDGSRVQQMRTHFRVLRRFGDATLIEALPITGRTHQIRLHLAAAGLPLIGDPKYGGPQTWRGAHYPRHLLHAHRLILPHPHNNAPFEILAVPPAWAERG
ncbi:MAG TPA: RluA family pseudouridine synthase [Roseiflexaceae bacterium]|nr:RluA family pseudouridine synthase [Roseiflexaceae bacterium]HMP42401.1 RluA family pseudouridine synthase [Roseiflexaceae bacterium]